MASRVLVADSVTPLVNASHRSGTTYQAGASLFYQGLAAVQTTERDSGMLWVSERRDGRKYQVRVFLSDAGPQVTCDCQRQRDGWCAHAVAGCLALQQHLRQNPPQYWQTALAAATRAPRVRASGGSRGSVIIFGIGHRYGGARIRPYLVSGTGVPDDLPENAAELATALYESGAIHGARAIQSRSDYSGIRNASGPVVGATALLVSGYTHYSQESILPSLLQMMPDCPLFRDDGSSTYSYQANLGAPVVVDRDPAVPALITSKDDAGARLVLGVRRAGAESPQPLGECTVVSRKPLWILGQDALFRVSESAEMLDALLRHRELSIPLEEIPEFVSGYLAPLAERMPVVGHFAPSEEVHADPVKRVYLEEAKGELLLWLRFGYGDYEVAFAPDYPAYGIAGIPAGSGLAKVHRQPSAEEEAWRALSSYGLKRGTQPGSFSLRKHVSVVDLLIHHVPRLVEAGFQVYGEEALTAARVNRSRPSLSLNVASGIDWFDVEAVVKFGELDVAWADVVKAIRRRERYVKLADGSIGELPSDWVERYRRILGLVEDSDAGLRLGAGQITVLDELLREADDPQVDPEFARRRERLRNVKEITPQPLPQGFRGELRPYQKSGFDWLHFLHEYGFGGCLADDMGTGKTIQALALLQSLKERGEAAGPALLVVPRSLLFNWQREAAQFTPGLRVAVHADGGRDQTMESFAEYDLVLTTYGVMLRDTEALRKYRFHYAILDESQAIKNPASLTARAARRLQADHRLVLTGTPVENTTLELWSQFAFLNPGLLGSFEYFRKEFALPIERSQDEGAADLLRRVVFPFILRRTKDQVASDLPPRSEEIVYCEMEPAQVKAYTRSRDYYRALILGLIDEEGMNNARMRLLEGLLRLRQISNHPRLVDPDFRGTSGKFDDLLEMLETLRAEGHKALVFSQFTQMLALVREALDTRGIPYEYLDGQTRDRSARVDSFQENADIPFFLISLKAGGVGLNLTAADYVIHIDPWWNPAVEMQASDRAHRIGQDKPVFVYRFIVRNSVEEKILKLQESKRALVNQLIQADAGMLKSLERTDVEMLFSE